MNYGALDKCNSTIIPLFTSNSPLFLSKDVVSWDDATTPDIKKYASRLALSMPQMIPLRRVEAVNVTYVSAKRILLYSQGDLINTAGLKLWLVTKVL